MELSVSKDKTGRVGIEQIPIRNILYLEWSGSIKRIIVHVTGGKKYYLTGPLNFWGELLSNSGFMFVDVDRNNWVNAMNVEWIDDGSFKRVCFEGGIYCSMRTTKRYLEALDTLVTANPSIKIGNKLKAKWSAV